MRTTKSIKVFDYLLKELDNLAPGDKLPSNLSLQQVCGVSQSVVTRAIDELKNLDLIEVRPKSGFYKKNKIKSTVHIVYLRKDDDPILNFTTFYSAHLTSMFHALSKSGYSVRYHHLENIADIASELSPNLSPSFRSDIVITFSLPENQIRQVLELEGKGIKFIHWLPDLVQAYPNSITINEDKLIEAQIECLKKHGHSKIAYAHRCVDGVWSRSSRGRYDTFCRQSINLRIKVLPEYLFYLDARITTQEELNHTVSKIFSLDEKPTAIIVVDVDAKMLYRALEENNLKPGIDVSILGTNNQVFCPYMSPALGGVGFDLDSAIQRLLDMLKDENTKEHPVWYFPLEVKELDSVKTIK